MKHIRDRALRGQGWKRKARTPPLLAELPGAGVDNRELRRTAGEHLPASVAITTPITEKIEAGLADWLGNGK